MYFNFLVWILTNFDTFIRLKVKVRHWVSIRRRSVNQHALYFERSCEFFNLRVFWNVGNYAAFYWFRPKSAPDCSSGDINLIKWEYPHVKRDINNFYSLCFIQLLRQKLARGDKNWQQIESKLHVRAEQKGWAKFFFLFYFCKVLGVVALILSDRFCNRQYTKVAQWRVLRVGLLFFCQNFIGESTYCL